MLSLGVKAVAGIVVGTVFVEALVVETVEVAGVFGWLKTGFVNTDLKLIKLIYLLWMKLDLTNQFN